MIIPRSVVEDFSFIHASDLHLDTPCSGLARTDPGLAKRVVDASLEALSAIVNRAIQAQVRFVLFAGDIYDGPVRGLRAQLRFRSEIKRLSEAGIWTFIVYGNHDPVGQGWSAIREWPPLVKVFGTQHETVALRDDAGNLYAVIHGVSYARRKETRNLMRGFSRTADSALQIGVLHCAFGDRFGHANYSPCGADDVLAAKLDYWALGHVHRFRKSQHHGAWVVYPGNTQGRSFAQGEQGPKGACIVRVASGEIATIEQFPTHSVRFESLHMTVGLDDSLDAALDRAVEGIGALTSDADVVVVRVRMEGQSEYWEDFARQGVADDLSQALAEGLTDRGDVYVGALSCQVQPPLNLDELAKRGDFIGEVIAERQAGSGELQAAGRWAKPAADLVRGMKPDEREELYDLATRRAVQLLNAEGS